MKDIYMNVDHLLQNVIPRLIVFSILTISIIGKIVNPTPILLIFDQLSFINNFSYPITILLILIEAIVAIYLFITPRKGVIMAIGLFSFFTLSILYLNSIGISDNCGCFGGLVTSEVGISKIIQNIIICLILVLTYWVNYFDSERTNQSI
jgi:hypothetical protein